MNQNQNESEKTVNSPTLTSNQNSNPTPNSKTNPSDSPSENQSAKSELEYHYLTGEHILPDQPALNELCDRLIEVYQHEDGELRMKFDKELLPETMAPVVACMRYVSCADVMRLHACLTEKNGFLTRHGSHWPVRGFLMDVSNYTIGLENHELYFPKWNTAIFSYDNGTITINIDGNIGVLKNCGDYAKLALTRLAPDLDEHHPTVGLYLYDKFSFGFKLEEENVSANFRVVLGDNVIDWNEPE